MDELIFNHASPKFDFLQISWQLAQSTPSTSSTEDEFNTYLSMCNANNSTDILKFWNEHKSQLPKMADIARQLLYLCQQRAQRETMSPNCR